MSLAAITSTPGSIPSSTRSKKTIRMTQTAARRAAFSGPVPKIDLSGQRFAVKKVDNVDYSVENISKTDTVYPQLSNF